MTIDEASENYNIPIEILKIYESWGLHSDVKKVMGAWHYDGRDLERLSMIMTPKNAAAHWTIFISGKNSWSGWIISGTNYRNQSADKL